MEFQLATSLFLFLQIILVSFLPKISAQFEFLHSRCGNASYYAPNSTYQSNLKTVLNSLSTNTRVTNGYYNFTAGESPNKVEAKVLCRGDVPVNNCRLCTRDSAATLPVLCPNQTEAFGYTDSCIIFYSNNSTFHVLRKRPRWALWNNKNVSNINGFNDTLTSLMSTLQNQASLGNSELKSSAAQTNITSTNQTMYGLVQCSPDLSRLDCVKCIQYLISSFFYKYFVTPTFIAAGARVITPSCNLRYEIYSFYGKVADVGPTPAPPPQLATPTASNRSTTAQVEKTKNPRITVRVITPIVGSLVLIISIAIVCILLRRKKQKTPTKKLNKEEMETLQSLQYSLGYIKVATNDFSDDNYLGEGGFGIVYKGKLPDEQEIAVKRLARNSVQGDEQFKNEILILAKLQHRNLVRLLGFCLEGEEMLLIYEFMINKSLDNFLFDPPTDESSLPWEKRWKIINGIARGLLYLHEDSRLRIIHRDLKAGNVLLDSDFNPKIADFGMARLFNIDQTQAMASRIVGTYGYMAPEYALHGHVSIKSDVFSYGVLVLEIVSGQRISSFQIGENLENLLTFAWKNWLEGKAWNLVDPSLSPAFSTEILRCIHIGLLCVQHNMADRPTMSSVELMLSSSSLTLQVPSQPGFFTRNHTQSTATSQENPSHESHESSSRLPVCSINEASMTQVYPR